MLPKFELDKAVELAKKYNIGKLYLVGSIIHKGPDKVADYDFAIDEYNPEIFFRFYSKLFQAMSKTVDLIDLSGEQTLFKKIVRSEGKLVYEKK
jgi:predicted nucleotidyltransferase